MTNVNRCVKTVVGAAHMSEREAQELLERIKDFRDEISSTTDYSKLGPEIEAFALEAGEEAEWAAIHARRRELIRAERAAEFQASYTARAETEKLRMDKAIAEEVWRIGTIQDGYVAQHTDKLIGALRENPTLQKLCDSDREFRMEVYRALEGGKDVQNPLAVELAEIMRQEVAAIRQALNDKGAAIGKIENYGLPHKHNSAKVLADPEGHAQMLRETLDWENTFPWLDRVKPEHLEEVKNSAIRSIQEHIVKGTEIEAGLADLAPYLKKGRKASTKFEHGRVLEFKGAAAWAKYNDRFGEGGILAGFFDHVQRSSATLAQMSVLGPNPMSTLSAAIEREKNQMKVSGGLDKKITKALNRLNAQNLDAGEGSIGRAWRMVSGADLAPENVTVARIASAARQVISMAKLGGAVISSVADMPVTAMHMKVAHGYSLMEAWGETIRMFMRRIPPELRREMAGYIDVFGDGVRGRLAARYDGAMNASGGLTRASERFFRLSGLTFWTDNGKAGGVQMLSHSLGRHADKALGHLPPELAYTLKKYKLDQHWDLVRRHMTFDHGGRKYVVPELARKIPDAEIDRLIADRVATLQKEAGSSGIDLAPAIDKMRREARRDIDMAVHSFFAGEVNTVMLTPDARTRQWQTWGAKPGSFVGEAARGAMQFKSFPITFIQKVMAPIWRGMPGQKMSGRIANLGLLMAQTTFFGYVAMEMKRLARGEKPYFASENANLAQVATAAFIQGGGAGIFGDFLLSESNRFGGGLAETMVGPAGGLLGDVHRLWALGLRGELKKADFLNAGLNYTPYANLFYTRGLLDYAVLYSARESLSPGWLRRKEANMKRESGREYIWPPSRHRLRTFE